MAKVKVSVIVLTFNEERNIKKCLESILWADEIIIVDSFSTDGTLDICKQYPTRIFQKKFHGYASQRNFGIKKSTGDWILMLDADEEVTPELASEIKEIVQQDNVINGYHILRNNFTFGKLLQHGVNCPDYPLRLFRSGKVKYIKEIHEIPIVDGKIGYLKNAISHKSYTTISEYLSKMNFFTDIEANEMIKKRAKISWFKIILYPILRFFWSYFIKSGWRDGFAGFLMSIYGSCYMLTKYLKYKEKTIKNADRD